MHRGHLGRSAEQTDYFPLIGESTDLFFGKNLFSVCADKIHPA